MKHEQAIARPSGFADDWESERKFWLAGEGQSVAITISEDGRLGLVAFEDDSSGGRQLGSVEGGIATQDSVNRLAEQIVAAVAAGEVIDPSKSRWASRVGA